MTAARARRRGATRSGCLERLLALAHDPIGARRLGSARARAGPLARGPLELDVDTPRRASTGRRVLEEPAEGEQGVGIDSRQKQIETCRSPAVTVKHCPETVLCQYSMGKLEQRRVPCKCFSTCTNSEASDFIANIPNMIDSDTSPWYRYLEAIYGGPVDLPYALGTLRYVYHHTGVWQRLHPSVEWPMPSCFVPRASIQSAFSSMWSWPYIMDDLKEVGSPQHCSQDVCKRWQLASRKLPGKNLAGLPIGIAGVLNQGSGCNRSQILNSSNYVAYQHIPDITWGTSAGFRWNIANDMPHVPDHSWVEVIRYNSPNEGVGGYGTWFYFARGSGIWINVGKSMRQMEENDAKLLQALRRAELNALLNATILAFAKEARSSQFGAELGMQVIANVLGFDSVQVSMDLASYDCPPDKSVLVHSPQIALVKSVGEYCCSACDPFRRALMCGGGSTTCGHNRLRRGYKAELSCMCSEYYLALNCLSSPTVLQPMPIVRQWISPVETTAVYVVYKLALFSRLAVRLV